jgi:hypothetical protein
MNRTLRSSDTDELESFEEAKGYDFATMGLMLALILLAVGVVWVFYALLATVEPGSDQRRQIQEIRL